MMPWESVASISMFSVTASGLLAAFALTFGASNLQITWSGFSVAGHYQDFRTGNTSLAKSFRPRSATL